MTKQKKLRFGVVGAGKIGTYHVRTLAKMPQVELVGVCDSNLWRAQMLAWRYNSVAYRNYQDIISQVDAIVVAVPTEHHAEVGTAAMEKGVHCMVEKPIAVSMEQARQLLEISQQKNVVLQVGHVERFNPAVVETMKHVKDPRFITIERLGPFDPRVASIGVILDLMIHDLDILLTMINSPVESFEAIGASILSPHEDIANVRLRFQSGCVADVTASRVSMERARRMRIYQPENYISVDYVSSRLKIYQKKNPVVQSLKDVDVIYPKLEKTEPIREELVHFIDCINKAKKPWPSGEGGIRALKLALQIADELQRYEISHPKNPNHPSHLFQSLVDLGKITSVMMEETLKDSGINKR
ncbi:MAG: Gfo/Idh/MocA family oxidoreductase [bacterium]